MNKIVTLLVMGFFVLSIISGAYAVELSGETEVSFGKNKANASANAKMNDSDDVDEEDEIEVKVLSDKQRELIINKVNVKTGLNITVDESASVGQNLRVYLSNGRYAQIRVLPETASATAEARINASCESDGCDIELKEVGRNEDVKVVYEVEAKKNAKLLGFIKTKMEVDVEVNAETGEVVSVKRPWWSFMAKEEAGADVETE